MDATTYEACSERLLPRLLEPISTVMSAGSMTFAHFMTRLYESLYG